MIEKINSFLEGNNIFTKSDLVNIKKGDYYLFLSDHIDLIDNLTLKDELSSFNITIPKLSPDIMYEIKFILYAQCNKILSLSKEYNYIMIENPYMIVVTENNELLSHNKLSYMRGKGKTKILFSNLYTTDAYDGLLDYNKLISIYSGVN